MNYTEVVTARIKRYVPSCAVAWELTPYGIRYLHPRKGWRAVSYRRMGVKLVPNTRG